MACFVVPAAEAMVVTALQKSAEKKENAEGRAKLGVLSKLLWGGSGLLAFEHVWHGEIVPWSPFLTAGMNEALHEMATTGVAMAVAVTAVWAVALAVLGSKRQKTAGKL